MPVDVLVGLTRFRELRFRIPSDSPPDAEHENGEKRQPNPLTVYQTPPKRIKHVKSQGRQ